MDHDFLPRRGQNRNLRPGIQSRQAFGNWERPKAFRPPEEVAAEDDQQAQNPQSFQASNATRPGNTYLENEEAATMGPDSGKPPRKSFKQWLKTRTKKQWVIIILILLMALSGLGFGAYQLWFKKDPPPKKSVIKQEPKPQPKAEPLYSTLSGLTITDPTINQRPVTAVMIENSPDARPQSGLNQAGVVFEAIAEGGITRFLTLFQDTEPDYIGPVRSVRPYYVQWAAGFDAAIAHVGGSGDALRMLRQEKVAKDLDQFFNPGPYHRVSNRFAPHNMYSSVVALRELQTQKGFTSNYKGFIRKTEAKAAAPTATTIDFNISGALYNAHYEYDGATNTYKRFEGGKPHTDEKSAAQLSPKVVVGLVLPQGSQGIYTTYNTLGSGEVFIFQDGIVTKGTWHKTDNNTQFTFTDANGAELKLNPGQTWISVVGSASRVSYK
ncbi:MAG TPA: DUF3048 domain-containing protein [Candidatus Saccharimonadales bacterium]